MEEQTIDELLTELLIIKDLYICGRMNQAICASVTAGSSKPKKSKENWVKYEELSDSYVNDSIQELMSREQFLIEKIEEFGPISLEVVYDTIYDEFDEELINDMMLDYYGGKDTVDFAIAYNQYSCDFNAILSEHVESEEFELG